MHPTLEATTPYVFEYANLGKLIKEVYDQDIEILQELIHSERVGHYTYHHFTVDGESELLDIGDEEILAEWIATGEIKYVESEWSGEKYATLGVHHILHRLFNDGYIPAGEYYMLVDW